MSERNKHLRKYDILKADSAVFIILEEIFQNDILDLHCKPMGFQIPSHRVWYIL